MNYKHIFSLGILMGLMYILGCKEEPVGQIPLDNVAPGTVSNTVVENINGGAKISFNLPEDEDLLYVQARYKVNGVEYQNSSSIYKNSVTVEGFGDTQEHTVELVCVDKSQNESQPVQVTIKPMTPPYQLIYNSFKLWADFGGCRATWTNKYKADVSVIIMVPDNFGVWGPEPYGTFYSNAPEGIGIVRGYPSEPHQFGVMVRDRWGNMSETLKTELTPMYEIKLEKPYGEMFLWKERYPNWPGPVSVSAVHGGETYEGDRPWDKYGWNIRNLWNDKINNGEGAHQYNELGIPYPFSVDLKVNVQLSRVVVNHRPTYYNYMDAGLHYQIWGTNSYIDDGDYSEWTLLLDCNPEKPSGLPPGSYTSEDKIWFDSGYEYTFPLDIPKVRYVRFIFDNPTPMAEITFYGDTSSAKP